MIKKLLLAGFVSVTAFAHEGHDHSGPATLKPQFNGIVKGNEKYFIEVTQSPQIIDIYIFPSDTDTKAPKTLDPTSVKLSASVELPRQKAVPIKLTPSGSHLTANFDSKNSHRVTVLVKIEEAHGDTLKYTFEKRK